MSHCEEILTNSPEQTHVFGQKLAERLDPGVVVALIGDLGSGKTCLIQGICEGLGVASPVTSPTFILIQEYQGRLPVYHFDLYRLNDDRELLALGYEEYFYGDGVCLVEWADKFPQLLPQNHLEVRLEIVNADTRKIILVAKP